MGDVNKTTHTGTAITNPSLTYLSNKTPIAIFTLQVKETWVNRSGVKQSRNNNIKFEGLHKNAYWIKDNVSAGKRFYIDGTIRTEVINQKEETKVRILHIIEEDNEDFSEGKGIGYREGLAQAMALIENSDTLSSAKAKLELVL